MGETPLVGSVVYNVARGVRAALRGSVTREFRSLMRSFKLGASRAPQLRT
jgi:hypothetical protein